MLGATGRPYASTSPTGIAGAMGTQTTIGMPACAVGGHTNCIGPAGVLTWKGIPGHTPSGTVTCI